MIGVSIEWVVRAWPDGEFLVVGDPSKELLGADDDIDEIDIEISRGRDLDFFGATVLG